MNHKSLTIAAATLVGLTALVGAFFWNVDSSPQQNSSLISPAATKLDPSPNIQTSPSVTPIPTLAGAETLLMQKIYGRFQAGDYRIALKLANDVLAQPKLYSVELTQWTRLQLPAILISLAWVRIKSEDCIEAVDFLKQAESMRNDPAITKGLAFCFAKLDSYPQAIPYFRDYLKDHPSDYDMTIMFMNVLESDQDFGQAIEVLQAFPHDEVRQKDIKELLANLRAKQQESPKQLQLSSEHFVFRFREDQSREIIDPLMEIAEQTLDEYADRYGFRKPQTPLEIILYPAKEFRLFIRGGGPEWAAGVFDGRIRIAVNEVNSVTQKNEIDRMKRLFRHELTHALLGYMIDFRPLPSWFNEGLAQYLECENFSECSGQNRNSAQKGKFLEASEFESNFMTMNAQKAERAYRQSLLLFTNTIFLARNASPEETIHQLVSVLDRRSDLTSDGLMAKIPLRFSQLHQYSAKVWAAKNHH